jgi:hypothetical protein
VSHPLGYHVVSRLADSRVIAPTPVERRLVSRLIFEMSRGLRLLAFNAPDTHLHIEHGEDRVVSGRLLRRIQTAIRRRLGVSIPFAPAEHRAIRHQSHLMHTFYYVLRQQVHHELCWDPYYEASNLPDLLGLRIVDNQASRAVRELLPRVKKTHLLGLLRVQSLEPAQGPPDEVIPAALAAAGLSSLAGRSDPVRKTRRAVIALLENQLSLSRIAEILEVRRESLSRLRRDMDASPEMLRAITLQLRLRQSVQPAPEGCFRDQSDV